MAESPQWAHAFGNSFKIAVATTLIATPLGTLAAIGLAYMNSRAKTLIVAIITAPLVVPIVVVAIAFYFLFAPLGVVNGRSEDHTSELQSLMSISYAVFCLKEKKKDHKTHHNTTYKPDS